MSLFDYVFDVATRAVALSDEHPVLVWSAIGGILTLTGVGLPTPEDIWLTLAGFLTFRAGFLNLEPVDGGSLGFVWYYFLLTLAFCSIANLIGDGCCWWVGKRYGLAVRDKIPLIRRLLPDSRVIKAEGWFTKYGGATVFLGRQMAGLRLVTFFSAGVMRMELKKFLFWDALGCCISIPVWLTLGAFAGSKFGKIETDPAAKEALKEWMGSTGGVVLLVAVGLIVAFLIYVKVSATLKGENLAEQLENLGEQHHSKVEAKDEQKRLARESRRMARIEDGLNE